MTAYLCISIDCECDKGPQWRSQRPLRFEGIIDGIGKRLNSLFRSYRAKATYLISPEVLRDPASVETLKRSASSHELGTHLHGEFAAPGAFEPEVTRVFQCDYSRELEAAKLASLTTAFTDVFGLEPRSFRAGRFGIGKNSLELLDALGYTVETSVTPFVKWTNAGSEDIDFRGAATQPYHPDPRAPHLRGDSRVLEVPVTIRRRALNRIPLIGMSIERRWLRPAWESSSSLVSLARDEIRDAHSRAPERPVVLNAMLHNVEVIPGASPYAQTEGEASRVIARLAALLAWAERESIRVIGLGDVPAILARHG